MTSPDLDAEIPEDLSSSSLGEEERGFVDAIRRTFQNDLEEIQRPPASQRSSVGSPRTIYLDFMTGIHDPSDRQSRRPSPYSFASTSPSELNVLPNFETAFTPAGMLMALRPFGSAGMGIVSNPLPYGNMNNQEWFANYVRQARTEAFGSVTEAMRRLTDQLEPSEKPEIDPVPLLDIYNVVLDTSQRQENCSICLEELGRTTRKTHHVRLPCLQEVEQDGVRVEKGQNHLFHSNCIAEWFKKSATCPLCRNNVGIDED